ncbi:APH(3') family aminoglycoside O-phosphotransferase [Paenochrobactrum glaciei]|uniref:Aminoglycoside 3'-phosphotransferase n=1 Tax=Paenochrobactrum glaciei TaxID=486407 RepID=A0ABN1G6W0_9HYPH
MARERDTQSITLPASMQSLIDGYSWKENLVGMSGGKVFRLVAPAGKSDLYLKYGHGSTARDITDEMVRLDWLKQHINVPEVLSFTKTGDEAWLLTRALTGRTAYQMLEDAPENHLLIVEACTRFLTKLHNIPVDDCPFNSSHHMRLALARKRLEAGLVDTDDFGGLYQGATAQQVWDDIQRCLPLAHEPVVTHGDFSLDNILISGTEVIGCIDVGRAGIADRYQDLAILWDCLGEFDASLQSHLWTAYGLASLNQNHLRFHLGLDEFF